MKNQFPKQDSGYTQELRSQKVSNIVGPMPPRLIRYGITAICIALFCVIGVSAFLPFRKVVSGVVYIRDVRFIDNDSIQAMALLKFDQSIITTNPERCRIVCSKSGYEINGIVFTYNFIRTEQGEYKACLKFDNNADLKLFENSEAGFKIVLSETTVLNRLLSTVRVKVN